MNTITSALDTNEVSCVNCKKICVELDPKESDQTLEWLCRLCQLDEVAEATKRGKSNFPRKNNLAHSKDANRTLKWLNIQFHPSFLPEEKKIYSKLTQANKSRKLTQSISQTFTDSR